VKFFALVLGVLLARVELPAKDRMERTVTVFVEGDPSVPLQIRAAAQGIASEMFAKIGIGINWELGRPLKHREGVIALRFVEAGKAEPEALAIAYPYEGSRVHLFWERISQGRQPHELLGHVMVHEIAHILQGIVRHSDQGIMKARWDPTDKAAMREHALTFDAADIDLIKLGLDSRMTRSGSHAAGR